MKRRATRRPSGRVSASVAAARLNSRSTTFNRFLSIGPIWRPARTGSVGRLGGKAELEDEELGRRELLGERRALDARQIRRQALALLGDQDRAGEAHALPGLGEAR